MKQQGLLVRVLVPVLIALILLPPLSCLIFQRAAQRSAYGQAADDLEVLREMVVPLMGSHFSGNQDISQEILSEQVSSFLRQAGSAAHRMGGQASLMILGTEYQMIYPRDEIERENALPLAQELGDELGAGRLAAAVEAVEWSSSDGEEYLVNIYEIPTPSVRLRYLIVYCSVSSISAWVTQASLLVLLISAAFVVLTIGVLWVTVRSVSRPLNRLCREAQKIGDGDFSKIQPPFSLRELEQLRLAMNEMSERLQRSNQVQKDFFQNVSHEMRNPLMSISGYAQGIEQGVFPAPKEAAHTILEESVRLTELVNSLLTLSRMESGQNRPEFGPVQIADVIGDSLDRFHGLALQRGISLTVGDFDRRMTVHGDEELLGNVVDNLLSNAIRYADSEVRVDAERLEGTVRISVLDDGAGIAKKDLPHLFERCYKGEGGNLGAIAGMRCCVDNQAFVKFR